MGRAEDLRLPGWAHLPGVTPGADHAPLEAAKELVPPRFEAPPAADHPAIRYGIRLCDSGFYWEAHEVLEAVWMAAALNGRDRTALRAIIQLANAGLKLRMGRPRAALRLLTETASLLDDVRPAAGESFADVLDAPGLAGDVRALIAALALGTSATGLPQISFRRSS
jgi:hypothetical protein